MLMLKTATVLEAISKRRRTARPAARAGMSKNIIFAATHSAEDALVLLDATADGLTAEHAAERLNAVGPNTIEAPTKTLVRRIADAFVDPFAGILAALALVSLYMTYIPLLPFGLRGIDDRGFDTLLGRMFFDGHPDANAPAGFASIGTPADDNLNPYLRAYQEDFAARAQWCAHDPAACSHPAHVVETTADRSATAGERVDLTATIVDPDGKGFDVHWDVAVDPSSYAGAQDLSLWQECTVDTAFIVPADARPGDRLVLTLTVQTRAERPCSRYAQVAVTVA